MKRVVSVSLGSSKRNHAVEIEVLGQKVLMERIGTDGSLAKAASLVAELDGRVDCFGLGGTDLYIYAGGKRYLIRDAAKIASNAKKTPIVDGTGLKNTLERKTVMYLQSVHGLKFKEKKVLMVCAMDRFGMAEEFEKAGAVMTYGDLMFGLGLQIPLHSLNALDRVARVIAPVVVKLPFKLLYPTGEKQDKLNKNTKYMKYYNEADVIAGDFHYIKKHMPLSLEGKIIITNTVTQEDISELKNRGAILLVTTTPHLNGRSFGTNVLEAVIVALSGKHVSKLTMDDYLTILDKLDFNPYLEWLQAAPKEAKEVIHG
ncbi:MAG: quinate 5-dehydrogenase [Bacillota bacterium]